MSIVHIQELYQQVQTPEIDYTALCHYLKNYAQPRNKIQHWVKTGDLIRIKKGFYLFGSKVLREPYSRELLANWIYGPSVLSLESALSYHGLIPEKVEAVTSITPKRNKQFLTPLGLFSYQHLSIAKYSVSIFRIVEGKHSFLIASPEKALADKLLFLKAKLASVEELEQYLEEDLRVEMSGLDKDRLLVIQSAYKHPHIDLLVKSRSGI
jgi:hypothetical protein